LLAVLQNIATASAAVGMSGVLDFIIIIIKLPN
jgi:hypothetical protein